MPTMSMNPTQLAEHFENKRIQDLRGHIAWVRDEIMKTHENAKAKLRSLLKEVHDKKSYAPDYGTFENYCLKEWKITKARAYQILSGEKFRLLLEGEGIADAASIPDGQIAELEDLTPAKAAKVYNKAKAKSDKTGKKLTAKDLAKAIAPTEVLPPPPVQCCKECGQPIKKSKISIPD